MGLANASIEVDEGWNLARKSGGVTQDQAPGEEDFSRGAIHRAVLAETLQHPLTILPAAVSAVSGLYMGLFGLGPEAFAVAFGGVLLAAGAWVYNYL